MQGFHYTHIKPEKNAFVGQASDPELQDMVIFVLFQIKPQLKHL